MNKKVLVIGDIMLDRYYIGKTTKIAPEAPIPLINIEKIKWCLGGASNMANNLASWNIHTILLGVISQGYKDLFTDLSLENGLDVSELCINTDSEPLIKNRITINNQHICRFDTGEIKYADHLRLKLNICNRLNTIMSEVDLLIISDYGEGLITNDLCIQAIKEAKINRIPIIIDPWVKNNDSWSKYQGATTITPNEKQLMEYYGQDEYNESTLSKFGIITCDALDLEYITITRGKAGILYVDRSGNTNDFPLPEEVNVQDATGAGDTVVATMAWGYLQGFTIPDILSFANIIAGEVIKRPNTSTVPYEVFQKYVNKEFVALVNF